MNICKQAQATAVGMPTEAQLAQINALIALELVSKPIDDALIPVIATQVVVAIGCCNFEYAIAQLKDGNIERAAADVVHKDLLVRLLIHAIGKCSCGGLVDDAEHF